MQREPPDRGALGYLKTILKALLWVILPCGISYVYFGPKGILVGIGSCVVVGFIIFFERVFAPTRKQ